MSDDWQTVFHTVTSDPARPTWQKMLAGDVELAGAIIADLLKLDQAAHRPGPRRQPTLKEAGFRLAQILGDDYTDRPYLEAFPPLVARYSQRQLANRMGVPRIHVRRLLSGERPPQGWDLQLSAEVAGKEPSYFREWRRLVVLGVMNEWLDRNFDHELAVFERLAGRWMADQRTSER